MDDRNSGTPSPRPLNRRRRYSLLGLVLALILGLSFDALAAGKQKFYVEMHQFRIPVIQVGGATVDTAIIAYLQIPTASQTRIICQWTPRIRDAIGSSLARHPAKLGKKGLDFRKMGRRLIKVVHRSMGAKTVLAVRIGQMRPLRGSWQMPAYSEHAVKCS
jgi:hypothetical protein